MSLVRIVTDEDTSQKLAYITYDDPNAALFATEVFNGEYCSSNKTYLFISNEAVYVERMIFLQLFLMLFLVLLLLLFSSLCTVIINNCCN